ncbi:PAS domain-containing protein, partial [Neobacillus cucumis]|uniref:PAS domain-containing protein n=1 Tax=Neobacillus cucumis TaxID=1740721 RepID=UPI002E1F11F9|nr:PAS domain-containing protein [Neobacillus cucumis]
MNVRSIASLSEENTIHTIFDSPELTIWYKDVQEDTLWISKGNASIYGYTQDYIMKNPFILLESVYPEDKWIIENAISKQLSGDSTDVEYRIIRSDGEVRWVQELSHSTLDEAGKVIAISGSVRDITLQKRDTQKLQNQLKMKEDQEQRDINDERYKSLFEHNTNSIYSFDLDGNFTSCNSVCEEVTGYRKEELLKPMNFKEMIVPEKLVEVLDYFARCIKGEAQNFRTSIVDRKGSI